MKVKFPGILYLVRGIKGRKGYRVKGFNQIVNETNED
jgi:hypothetical protein